MTKKIHNEETKFNILLNQLHVQRLVCMTAAPPTSYIHVVSYLALLNPSVPTFN